ncbi:DUF4760 domain-containing protein, partial [Chromohalobacter sp.]|uniref:DUF4760 domain-containing protein n=1 Tax=Chromohalobacter sp. TaxID=50740 RepID=UPI00258A0FB4
MSDIAFILQLISTAIMLIGVIFGVQNIRQYQVSRKRESAILMLNSFQTGEFVKGLMLILNFPGQMRKADVDGLPPDQFQALHIVVGTWERLGVLVFRHEIDLDLVDDAFSGPIIQSWQKLGLYIQEFRAQMQRDTAMEWFQWLAERLLERETNSTPMPA